jgi:GT2 family glycosyltransferase
MLTISTLNYRNWRDTAQLIRDIAAACQRMEYRVLVRDNSETSEVGVLRADLENVGAPVSYFESPDNPGFAGGHNRNFRAVDHAVGDVFLVLNNDIRILDPDLVGSMLRASGPERLVACVIQSSEPGGLWFTGGVVNRLTGDVRVCREPFVGPQRSAEFLTGCCLMVPASLFESLGGFDERFFMYAEDVEFCLRARAVGAEMIVVNHGIVHAVGSGEKGTYSDLYLYWNTRNRLIVLRQHRLGAPLLATGFYWLKYGAARSLQLALRSSSPLRQTGVVWRGLWDGQFHADRRCTAHEKSAYTKWPGGRQPLTFAGHAANDEKRLAGAPQP